MFSTASQSVALGRGSLFASESARLRHDAIDDTLLLQWAPRLFGQAVKLLDTFAPLANSSISIGKRRRE